MTSLSSPADAGLARARGMARTHTEVDPGASAVRDRPVVMVFGAVVPDEQQLSQELLQARRTRDTAGDTCNLIMPKSAAQRQPPM